MCTFPPRLVLWPPLAWWEWWVAAFMTFHQYLHTKVVLRAYYSVYTCCCVRWDFQSSPLVYLCRVEGSWICLAWWEKWWETWWVSSKSHSAECWDKARVLNRTPSDHSLLFSSFRNGCLVHRTVRHFPLRQWSPTPPQTQGLLKFISRLVKQGRVQEGWA